MPEKHSNEMMEDMGYFCIDNLPIQLLDKLIDFSNTFHSDVSKVAVGIDVRNGSGIDEIPQTLEQLRQKNFPYEILFLDAEDEVLVKRYKETRRNHPLAGSERINKGIVLEREKLQYLKDNADYIIDTSQLLTRELKIELERYLCRMRITKICLSRYCPSASSMAYRQTLI